MSDGPVRVEPLLDGALWRIVFGETKGNVLDGRLVSALLEVVDRARGQAPLKALLVEGQGEHFSYGASVEEHLPERVAGMLRGFHSLIGALLELPVATVAVVRGQCLGGGLELALACHRIVAAPGARLGQPEIALGVFAPVASLLLAGRVGRPRAEELCLTGRAVAAAEALRLGLVDELAEDPAAAALGYARERLLPHSAASLRFALEAVRGGAGARFRADVERVERLYLDGLMKTADAVEGIRAFLEKRRPGWRDA